MFYWNPPAFPFCLARLKPLEQRRTTGTLRRICGKMMNCDILPKKRESSVTRSTSCSINQHRIGPLELSACSARVERSLELEYAFNRTSMPLVVQLTPQFVSLERKMLAKALLLSVSLLSSWDGERGSGCRCLLKHARPCQSSVLR